MFFSSAIHDVELLVRQTGSEYVADFLVHFDDNPGQTAISNAFFENGTLSLMTGGSGGFSFIVSIPNTYQAPAFNSYYDQDINEYKVVGLGMYVTNFEEIRDTSITSNVYSIGIALAYSGEGFSIARYFII
jgi:hypothetical protein